MEQQYLENSYKFLYNIFILSLNLTWFKIKNWKKT